MKYLIKSREIILRPIRKSDKYPLVKNINDKAVYRYTMRIPYPYTEKYADKWIRYCSKMGKKKNPKELYFVIEIKGNMVGGIGLAEIEGHKAEIGYWLGRRHWNKGTASKSVRLVTDFAFKNMKLKRIYAPIFVKNRASQRVLEKNGYKREGILRKHYIKDGKLIDAMLYAKVR